VQKIAWILGTLGPAWKWGTSGALEDPQPESARARVALEVGSVDEAWGCRGQTVMGAVYSLGFVGAILTLGQL
jgi:hypothetical protein